MERQWKVELQGLRDLLLAEERSFTLLARRQPATPDLRFLVAGIKISRDLELIGDQAVSVATPTTRWTTSRTTPFRSSSPSR